MAKKKNSLSTNTVLAAVLFILIGILFVAFRSGLLGWALTVSGILAIAYGIYLIIKKDIVLGIIVVILGVALILGGWLFLEIILIVFGIALIAYGIKGLVTALQAKSKSFFAILVSCLTIVAGILFVVSKWAILDWMFIVIGIVLIVDGVMALINK